jgi:hypothetical protein
VTEWNWRTQQILDERAVVEHIRRNGYIGHETLGDVGFAEHGIGDSRGLARGKSVLWPSGPSYPPKPKYEPMF